MDHAFCRLVATYNLGLLKYGVTADNSRPTD